MVEQPTRALDLISDAILDLGRIELHSGQDLCAFIPCLQAIDAEIPAGFERVHAIIQLAVSRLDSGLSEDSDLQEYRHGLELILNAAERHLMQDPNSETMVEEALILFGSPVSQGPDYQGILNALAMRLIEVDADDRNAFQEFAAGMLDEIDRIDWPASICEVMLTARQVIAENRRARKVIRCETVNRLNDLFEAIMLALERENQGLPGKAAIKMDQPENSAAIAAEPSAASEPEEAADPEPEPAPADYNPDDQDDRIALSDDVDPYVLEKCIEESGDLLREAEEALLVLEDQPTNADALNTVFRSFHTIKGSASYLGIPYADRLAHAAESVLSKIRDREMAYSRPLADIALRSVDMLKALLVSVQNAVSTDGFIAQPEGFSSLICQLSSSVSTDPGHDLTAAADQSAPDSETAEDLTALSNGGSEYSETNLQEQSIRIKIARLDQLIDMVGELVVSTSILTQDETVNHSAQYLLKRKVNQTEKIVRELQDLSLSMRMVPLQPVFHSMNRLVRDVARRSGKDVQLIMDGEDTEIDRNMVNVIQDPLTHIIRNAIDHGIESPSEREQAGKPVPARIELQAMHVGGNILVEIRDDGRGLNRDAILARARERGIADIDENAGDREVFGLVFEPGFSTAQEVTDISGRGVGLDVVRKGIESLRGSVDIVSTPGKGTQFTLRLPLTLAITDGMLLQAGTQRYILPTINIFTTVRPEPDDIRTVTGKGEMFVTADGMLPIMRLHKVFDLPDAVEDPCLGLLIIINETERPFALLVDRLLGQMQVVIKSISRGLGHIKGVSGGAVLGDGQVGLILDTPALSEMTPKMEMSESLA